MAHGEPHLNQKGLIFRLCESRIHGINLEMPPLLGYSLFLDDMICIAEQDIAKYEASSAAPRPRPGVLQHTGRRGQRRYQPYERWESRGVSQTDQSQPWQHFPEAVAEIEEGVVLLTLVSPDPGVSKRKK